MTSKRSNNLIIPVIILSITLTANLILVPILLKQSEDPPSWTLEDYGFDEDILDKAFAEFSSYSFIRSALVTRYNDTVIEWYFNDGSREAAFHIHSASKSFMSTIFGIAVDKGYFPNLDEAIMNYLPEYTHLPLDPMVYNVTIEHLLEMKAGFNFGENVSDYVAYSQSADWTRFTLELGFQFPPGVSWAYCTPQTNLLSVILTKATGMSTKAFAELYLFDPLNMTISYWQQDPQGYYTGGHEMYYTPRNMTRFGLMCLNYGQYNGNKVVSRNWLEQATIDRTFRGYGYQWWIEEVFGYHMFYAGGQGGQFIFCIPDLDLVVVTTASGSIFDEYPNQLGMIFSTVKYRIIAAIEGVG